MKDIKEVVKNMTTESDEIFAFVNIKYKKYFVSDITAQNKIRIFDNREDWLNHLKKLDKEYNKRGKKYRYYKEEKIPEAIPEAKYSKYIAILANKYWEKEKVLRNGPYVIAFYTQHFKDLHSLLQKAFVDEDKKYFNSWLLYLLIPQKALFYYRKENNSEKAKLLRRVLYGELFRLEFVEIF